MGKIKLARFMLRYGPNADRNPHELELQAHLPELTQLFTGDVVPNTISRQAGDLLYELFTKSSSISLTT